MTAGALSRRPHGAAHFMSTSAGDGSSASYILGADRNEPDARKAHLYACDADGNLWPMCGNGWNRSHGERFSILRGSGSAKGECQVCRRRAANGLPPIKDGWPHPTRWL